MDRWTSLGILLGRTEKRLYIRQCDGLSLVWYDQSMMNARQLIGATCCLFQEDWSTFTTSCRPLECEIRHIRGNACEASTEAVAHHHFRVPNRSSYLLKIIQLKRNFLNNRLFAGVLCGWESYWNRWQLLSKVSLC